jgi:hypothetical protein
MQNASQAIQKREAPSASQNPFESSSRIMQLGLLGLARKRLADWQARQRRK